MARIDGLDIARGVAILGTLGTNIWIVSHPAGLLGYLTDPVSQGVPTWQAWTEQVLQQLAQGKFLGLLTLMFGIGLAIQADSVQRAGRRWPGSYGWRAAILFLDGLLHYLLVVEFDVLMGYAVTGAVVAYVIAGSPRSQRWWVGAAAGVHVLLVTLLTVGLWSEEGGSIGGAPVANLYRDGSWWDLFLLRLDAFALFRFESVFMIALGVVMFTVGAHLYRSGLFEERGATMRRRLMAVGAVALVADLVLGLASPNWLFVVRYGTAPIAALGLLSLIAEVTRRSSLGWVGRRLSELGRVALSGYVLQNVLATTLFYGWGFDLGGVDPTWRLPVTVAAWVLVSALVLLAAHLWLRRHRRGPLEWLWAAGYARLAGAGEQRRVAPREVGPSGVRA